MHVDIKSDYFFLQRLVPCCAINESQDLGVCNYTIFIVLLAKKLLKKNLLGSSVHVGTTCM